MAKKIIIFIVLLSTFLTLLIVPSSATEYIDSGKYTYTGDSYWGVQYDLVMYYNGVHNSIEFRLFDSNDRIKASTREDEGIWLDKSNYNIAGLATVERGEDVYFGYQINIDIAGIAEKYREGGRYPWLSRFEGAASDRIALFVGVLECQARWVVGIEPTYYDSIPAFGNSLVLSLGLDIYSIQYQPEREIKRTVGLVVYEHLQQTDQTYVFSNTYHLTMIPPEVFDIEGKYNNGYNVGYNAGYGAGHTDGMSEGTSSGLDFYRLINALFTAPFELVFTVLSFDMFGVNMANAVKVIITMMLMLFVILKILSVIF